MTSQSFNGRPLPGMGVYPSYIACNLYGKDGTRFLSMIKHFKGNTPYLTQDGGDRENGDDQYISNFCDGSVTGFKYFDLSGSRKIAVKLKGKGTGNITVRTSEENMAVERISVSDIKGEKPKLYFGKLPGNLTEKEAIYIGYEGKGRFDFISFELY